MRWVKLYTNVHNSEPMRELLSQVGHIALCYYILLEMCAEKLSCEGKILTESDMVFSFEERILRERMRLSPRKLREFLKISSEKFKFSLEISENFFKIKMPMLLKLLHTDLKKSRANQEQIKSKSRTKREQVKSSTQVTTVTGEGSGVLSKTTEERLAEKEASSQNRRIKEAYIEAYKAKYGVEPLTQNATFNSQCNMLRKKVGFETAIELVKFYLNHQKSFYASKTHSFGLLLADAETLVAQMRMGVTVTGFESRQIEESAGLMAQLERLRRK